MTRAKRWVAVALSSVALTAVALAPATAGAAGGANQCRNQKGAQLNALSCNSLDVSKNHVKIDIL